ncbi:sulfatase [Chitinophaga caeni]|nr:sulfatase [Chitinophaga caeni]
MLLLFLATISLATYAQERPNIIVFLVDDMGWMDNTVPFSGKKQGFNFIYHTPNMERLAAKGMIFTDAYATPVCTPSRLSLLTGMNAAHHGVTNWTSPRKNQPTDNADSMFLPANWRYNGITTGKPDRTSFAATTYPQLLKDNGYFTVHAGKAHWGPMGTTGANPRNLGYVINISGHAAGHPQSYLSEEFYGNKPGKNSAQSVPDLEEYYNTGTFLTEALTLEALKALEFPVNQQQPFYLNLAHYAVHAPIQGDDRYLQKYIDAGMDIREAKYATLLEGMDKSLGDVMDFLEQHHIEKNTVIIFMSDNGGLSLSSQRGGAAHTQNLPLRAGKGSVYEGGTREPMIVAWPGQVAAGTVTHQPVIIEDFFPTILEMAGITGYKTLQTVDGISFMPILKKPGFKDDTRTFVWHFPNKWIPRDGPGINYCSAIRQGDWKLVLHLRDGRRELYNLKQDIGETNDLSKLNKEKTDELYKLLVTKLKVWNAPMPVLKSTGKPLILN